MARVSHWPVWACLARGEIRTFPNWPALCPPSSPQKVPGKLAGCTGPGSRWAQTAVPSRLVLIARGGCFSDAGVIVYLL